MVVRLQVSCTTRAVAFAYQSLLGELPKQTSQGLRQRFATGRYSRRNGRLGTGLYTRLRQHQAKGGGLAGGPSLVGHEPLAGRTWPRRPRESVGGAIPSPRA